MDAAIVTGDGVMEHDCKQDENQLSFRGPIVFSMPAEDGSSSVKYTEYFEGEDQESAPHVDSPALFEQELTRYRGQLGPLFKSEQEFETFMRLPISKDQRTALLQKLLSVQGAKRGRE